jgi:hypothetical protein
MKIVELLDVLLELIHIHRFCAYLIFKCSPEEETHQCQSNMNTTVATLLGQVPFGKEQTLFAKCAHKV